MPRPATLLLLLFVATQAVRAQGRKAPVQQASVSPLAKGIAHFDAERLEPAKAAFTPLAAAGDPDAMYYLGRIAIEQSQPDTAVNWLEQAVKKNDASSLYHQWLATAYSARMLAGGMMAQMSGAPAFKRELLRAVELDSTNIDARVTLAQFYVQAPPM